MRSSILYLLFFCFHLPAFAEQIVLPVNKSLNAEATFLKGATDKPAILILHGFLTTNQFSTIQSIQSAYNDAGYTTLTPTLTLGISQRERTLKCNAIHSHTFEQDIHEVHLWLDWLKQQGHQKIIAVGHSTGSYHLLSALNSKPDPAVKSAIYISLFFVGKNMGTSIEDIQKAQEMQRQNNNSIDIFSILFCHRNYIASPDSFLSYIKVDRSYILEKLKHTKTPAHIIMGSADQRYQKTGLYWIDELRQNSDSLLIIEGANHFFSNEHEFDLQEKIIEITQQINL